MNNKNLKIGKWENGKIENEKMGIYVKKMGKWYNKIFNLMNLMNLKNLINLMNLKNLINLKNLMNLINLKN